VHEPPRQVHFDVTSILHPILLVQVYRWAGHPIIGSEWADPVDIRTPLGGDVGVDLTIGDTNHRAIVAFDVASGQQLRLEGVSGEITDRRLASFQPDSVHVFYQLK
jgi:hypothetical protein